MWSRPSGSPGPAGGAAPGRGAPRSPPGAGPRALRRQTQQPELVGNGGGGFPQLLRRLLPAQAENAVRRSMPSASRRIQVPALEIFHQGQQAGLLCGDLTRCRAPSGARQLGRRSRRSPATSS
jgi:hypothetical protein